MFLVDSPILFIIVVSVVKLSNMFILGRIPQSVVCLNS